MRVASQIISFLALFPICVATRADLPDANGTATNGADPTISVKVDGAEHSAIDEIVVIESKSIRQLRFELSKADDRVFDLYNELNPNDALDVICKKETKIESQIKYRVCKTAYHRQLESESATDLLLGDEQLTSTKPAASHYRDVRSNMARLMAEHPELQQAVKRRAALRKKISALREAN